MSSAKLRLEGGGECRSRVWGVWGVWGVFVASVWRVCGAGVACVWCVVWCVCVCGCGWVVAGVVVVSHHEGVVVVTPSAAVGVGTAIPWVQ